MTSQETEQDDVLPLTVKSQAAAIAKTEVSKLEKQDKDARQGRTLRLALAMRGGVSLAVWIGGAVAEIDVLRRARFILEEDAVAPNAFGESERKRAEIYHDLMAVAGFDRVEVDILAGASAGGLNGVVYAFAQSGGHRIDWLKPVWVKTGGLWQLLRRPGPFARPESLLDGDGYFYGSVLTELRKRLLSSEPDPRIVASRISLDLSATLLETYTDSGQTRPGDPPRSTAHFHFDRRPAPPGSVFTDIPGLHAHDRNPRISAVQTARLALAARSTSSFPGAFEPASIYTTQDDWAVDGIPSMLGVFSEVRTDEEFGVSHGSRPFRVIDGGVFDNIPVTRALQAIAAAPALGRTDRRLIYLDPSPPVEAPPKEPNASAPGWLSVVVRSVLLKQRQELEIDELETLREHNETQRILEQRQRVLANWLATRDWPRSVDSGAESYMTYRAAADARRLADVLTRPNIALLRAWLRPRPFRAMTVEESLRIRRPIEAFYLEYYNAKSPGLARDPQGLLDALTLLLAWLRALENLVDRNNRTTIPEKLQQLKTPVYRLLAIALHLRNLTDTALLDTCLGRLDGLTAGLRASATCYQSIKSLPLLIDAIQDEDAPTQVADAGFWSAMHMAFGPDGASPSLVPMTRPSAGEQPTSATPAADVLQGRPSQSLIDDLWRQAEVIYEALIDQPPLTWIDDEQGRAGDRWTPESREEWENDAFLHLYAVPAGRDGIDRIHTLFATAGGVPGTSSVIRYHRITADQSSPLAGHFVELEQGALARVVNRFVDRPELAEQPAPSLFDASTKLAGNSLSNFAGFLNGEWRRRDWIWGRADASAGMVDVLLPSVLQPGEPLRALWSACVEKRLPHESSKDWRVVLGLGALAPIPTPGTGQALTPLQLAVLRRGVQAWLQYWTMAGEANDDRRPPSSPEETTVEPPTLAAAVEVLDHPKPTLASLPKGYTFALASRLAALAPRVLMPSRWTWRTVLARIALIGLRPVFALVPLFTDPVRILAVAALIGLVLLPADADVTGPPGGNGAPAGGGDLTNVQDLTQQSAQAWVLSTLALVVAFVIVARLSAALQRWRLAIRNATASAESTDEPGVSTSWPPIVAELKRSYVRVRVLYLVPGIGLGVLVILLVSGLTGAALFHSFFGEESSGPETRGSWDWLVQIYDAVFGRGAVGAVGVVALLVLGLWVTGRAQTWHRGMKLPTLPRIGGGLLTVAAAVWTQLEAELDWPAGDVPFWQDFKTWWTGEGALVLCAIAGALLVFLLHHPWTSLWWTVPLMVLGASASVAWVGAAGWKQDNLAALAVGVVVIAIITVTNQVVPPARTVRGS